MNALKTSVTLLQELCSQRKIEFPTYTIIEDKDIGFICKIEIMDIEEYGNGRSKRDAKHLAANAALKRLRFDFDVELPVENVENDDFSENILMPPNVDMIAALRNYCVQHEHPLPKFELVNQYGTPNAPRFTMLCQIATIVRYGKSDNKKEAKQKAAFSIFLAIKDLKTTISDEVEIVAVNAKIENFEDDRYRIFKTYRELVDSGESTEKFGIRMDERHEYFTRFPKDKKLAALNVLVTDYESAKTQAFDIFEELKIRPKISNLSSESVCEMISVDFCCEGFDVYLAGFEDNIYKDICDYFRIMLE